MTKTKFALVLSGGGAKGAWEAGFLKYVAENWGHKFSVVCGSSIGAMNGAVYCAAAHDEKNLPNKIVEIWNKITFTQAVGIPFRDYLKGNVCSLLDNEPLAKFVKQNFNKVQYRKNIDNGIVDANIVATTSLDSRKPCMWIDTKNNKNYDAPNWFTRKTNITDDHLVASGAIPIAFKPRNIEGKWHADGSICNNTPIYPAIMTFFNDSNGATLPTNDDPKTKILVITQPDPDIDTHVTNPNILVSASRIADAIFVNHLLQDIAKANIINDFLGSMKVQSYGKYRKIELLIARPSSSLDTPAIDAAADLGLGFLPDNVSSSLSFMFIVQPYIQRLLKLGYDEAKSMHSQLEEFFKE